MYAEILDGKITHYRGDTLSASIKIFTGDRLSPEAYTISENDTLYLGIMEPQQSFEDAVIKKVYTLQNSEKDKDGNVLFKLSSTDTEFLSPGTYYYMLKIRRQREQEVTVDTIIKPTLFWLVGNIPEQNEESSDESFNTIILDGGEIE